MVAGVDGHARGGAHVGRVGDIRLIDRHEVGGAVRRQRGRQHGGEARVVVARPRDRGGRGEREGQQESAGHARHGLRSFS